ncbi:hypothetical protein AY607_14400 [Acinetobacter sp. SFA]|nr:hypothetical protein AY607_14400 [Acinetobacter sp. SFA]
MIKGKRRQALFFIFIVILSLLFFLLLLITLQQSPPSFLSRNERDVRFSLMKSKISPKRKKKKLSKDR